jgi:NAD-dependent dihydropyrimidine dehydrogenase PreA subunit
VKGVIFYYSGTGNTALAARYVAKGLPIPFDLIDVTKTSDIDVSSADIVGFASSTDFWGVPHALETYVDGLPQQDGKPAFVINTFGAVSGQTLRILAEQVGARGFGVLLGHSLRTPENYPPMIAGKMGAPNAPSLRQLADLDAFIAELAALVTSLQAGQRVVGRKVHVGLANGLFPRRARTAARDDMGVKHVDAELCTECGLCARRCPYGAIMLDPKPVFDMSRCYGCWRCYNLCPEHAIYTDKFRGGPYYAGPSHAVKTKLKA